MSQRNEQRMARVEWLAVHRAVTGATGRASDGACAGVNVEVVRSGHREFGLSRGSARSAPAARCGSPVQNDAQGPLRSTLELLSVRAPECGFSNRSVPVLDHHLLQVLDALLLLADVVERRDDVVPAGLGVPGYPPDETAEFPSSVALTRRLACRI
jgi:hypothetical protein